MAIIPMWLPETHSTNDITYINIGLAGAHGVAVSCKDSPVLYLQVRFHLSRRWR